MTLETNGRYTPFNETKLLYVSLKNNKNHMQKSIELYKYTNREWISRCQNTWGEIFMEEIRDNLFFKVE